MDPQFAYAIAYRFPVAEGAERKAINPREDRRPNFFVINQFDPVAVRIPTLHRSIVEDRRISHDFECSL